LKGEQANHASEIGVDSKFIDITLYNNGSLKDLERKIERIIEDAGSH